MITDEVVLQMSGPELAEGSSQPIAPVLLMSGYNYDATVKDGILDEKPFHAKAF